MKLLLPGNIAEVTGLKNAAQYNDCRGLILGESKPDNNGNPRHPIRLFQHKGKVLDVRIDNLRHALDLDEWKMPQLGGFSIMETILYKKSLANEDNCSDFAVKLWGEMAEQGPAHPLTIDHELLARKCILEARGRKLYWLALDAIGHHLLIEKCHGAYRVYQAYVEQRTFGGYTASQWCFGDMRNKPAWVKFGGGKLLIDKDINDLLDLVVKWQKLTQTVLRDVLLYAVPGLDPLAIPHLHKSNAEYGMPMDVIGPAIEHVRKWSIRMINRIGPEGCTDIGINPHDRRVSCGISDVTILIGYPQNGEPVFSIPASLYNQCDALNRELTGEPIIPSVFFMMLNTGVWWECQRDPDTGSAVGFSFRGMDMDLHLSEEEGRMRAEKMKQAAVDDAVNRVMKNRK